MTINVAGQGLFAIGQVSSATTPRTDWPNRYGADIDLITLIDPPIPLEELRQKVPDLAWARYPLMYTTPSPELTNQIRTLISQRLAAQYFDIRADKQAAALIETLNRQELREIALSRSRKNVSAQVRKILIRRRNQVIRRYVLARAEGKCEGCLNPAPFTGVNGEPFLEAHHVKRLSQEGPDSIRYVIALCPNCHRRTEFSQGAKTFNRTLVEKMSKLEPRLKASR
ncbi:HNH endonuclease [Terracidiphilus sp.]|uniref:HNH endonuclease n=1 Tax=Terracidiphilus sp. TaxID=1964191 RepID=UPI003C150D09